MAKSSIEYSLSLPMAALSMPDLLKTTSMTLPRNRGTDIVMAEETTRQPMPAGEHRNGFRIGEDPEDMWVVAT